MVGVATLLAPGTAAAHTGFDSSDPAAGSIIGEPVDVVTISFTGDASVVGDEIIALTPDGALQRPVSIETTDDRVFLARFDPPLAGGEVGIRWHVQAADAHPIEGAFAFTVDAPTAPVTTPPTVAAATVVPSTSDPTPTVAPAVGPAIGSSTSPATPSTTSPTTQPASSETIATTVPAIVEPDDSVEAEAAGVPAGDAPPSEESATPTLDEFLAVGDSTPGESTATVGRLIGLLGVVIALGTLAFAGTTLRGLPGEVRRTLAAVRVLGMVIAIGAFVEYLGVRRIGGGSFVSGWTTAPGFATALRVVGGLALAIGLAAATTRHQTRPVPPHRSLSAAVVDDRLLGSDDDGADDAMVRWAPDRRSWPVLVGVVAIIVSYWFDGHTVSKGVRPLHAMVNSVHVASGSIWAGGVVAMAAVVWSRHRSGRPARAAELIIRFSTIATIALAAVVVAGGVMAFFVLDSFGDLTGTTWGQLLLLKTGAVTLAMIGGAVNHFRLRPALEADPDSPELAAELRSMITAEAIVLIFVIVVTAWLATAAS